MTENSRAGLTMLAPDREVLLAGEDCHQPALEAHASRADGRHVVVELGFVPAQAGQDRRGIEVRLDGQRVGGFDAQTSERYARLLDDMLSFGGRPACIAQIVDGPQGLGLELRLPTVPVHPAGPLESLPVSAGAAADPPRPRQRTPYLVGAGVAALLVVVGVSLGHGGNAPTVPTADGGAVVVATTTAAPIPTRPPEVTTAQRAAPAPAPRPAPAPGPQPAPEPEAAPQDEPAPPDDCDPNYGYCVPVAEDVDCADEDGDGPAYVSGPVEVIGADVYDLDPDEDGTAC